MQSEKHQKAAELSGGDGEAFAELFHSSQMQEILSQDTEDEEQVIGGVRNNEVGEDGMSVAAGTDEAQDAEAVADRGAVHEVDEGAVIIGMDTAGAFGPTAGAGLKFGAETIHKGIK